MTDVHPDAIRGPIMDAAAVALADREAQYIVEKENLENDFRRDVEDNRNSLASELVAAGFGPDGSTPSTWPAGMGPENTIAPAMAGVATQGLTLSSDQGTWLRATSLTTVWQRADPDGSNLENIAGSEDLPDYVLTAGDVGKKVRSYVTVSNPLGSVSVPSNWSATVAAA